jgi:hypothetical protein
LPFTENKKNAYLPAPGRLSTAGADAAPHGRRQKIMLSEQENGHVKSQMFLQ